MNSVISYSSSIFLPLHKSIGKVHSIYEHAINITNDNDDKLVTILKESTPLVPDSFILDEDIFAQIHNLNIDDEVIYDGYVIKIKDYEFDFSKANKIDLNIKRYNFPIEAINKIVKYEKEAKGLNYLSDNRRLMVLNSLHNFARSGDFSDVKDVLGYGIGLTPTSDDMIVGIMLILWCLGKYKMVEKNTFKANILHVTTDISVKYFTCANLGVFSQILNNCVLKFSCNSDIEKAIEVLKSVGSSSGEDTLQGMIIALKENYLKG